MAILVSDATTWATSYLKGITFSTADELSLANNVQSAVSSFYRWHWTQTAGTDIALASGTQGYNLAAADQNKVLELAYANIKSGSTELPELLIYSDPVVPLTSTT